MRPPASPVGSVLSDTHSMNPGNGACSSILPGSEEGIGGRHGFPDRNTADLDAGRCRFAPRRRTGDGAAKDGVAFSGAPTAITSARRRGTSSRSAPRAWSASPWATRPRLCRPGAACGRCSAPIRSLRSSHVATGRRFPSTCRCPRWRAASSWSPPGAMLALMAELLVTALTGARLGFEASPFLVDEGDKPQIGRAFWSSIRGH
jgi:hypothetical protein